jgi:hypothetical protein
VEDQLRPVPLEQRGEGVRSNVEVLEGELLAVGPGLAQVGDPARGQVVHRDHPPALGQEPVAQV